MSNQDSTLALLVPETDSVFTLHFERNTYHFPQGSTSEIDVEHLQVIQSTANSFKADFGDLFQSITDVFELLCNPEWVNFDQTFDRLENIINRICHKVIPSRQRELAVYLEAFHSLTNKTFSKQQLYLRRVYKEPSSKRRYEKVQRVPLLSSSFKKLHSYSEAKNVNSLSEASCVGSHYNDLGIEVSRFGEEQSQD